MATTVLANLLNPQVVADFIDDNLIDKIVFAPLAVVDGTLEGRPGSIVTLPKWNYIGAASVVAENASIPVASITQSTATVAIHKLAKATEFTDEALLSGFNNDIAEQSALQLTKAIADAVDKEILVILESIASTMTQSVATTGIVADDINNALELFGEDVDDGERVLVVNPATATTLRKASAWLPASEIAADRMVRGVVGEIYGCQVLISNRLKDKNEAFIVKPGALRIFLKRDTQVETDRDILYKKTVLSADKHYAGYLYNEAMAVKLA